MSKFLAIYSKTKQLQKKEVEKVLEDFTLLGNRPVITKEFPGMILCYATKFSRHFVETENSLCFISGHISFEVINQKKSAENEAALFDEYISTHGSGILSELEGAFAAIRYNKHDHTLLLVNDKFGVFPLFIFEDKNYVIVSSEYEPIIQYQPQKTRKPDYNAIAEFFTLGLTLGNKTFFKKIKNLTPGSRTLINNNRTETEKYWEPFNSAPKKTSLKDLSKEVLEIFTKINREYNETNLTDMCLLSAGADSRLILATMTQDQRQKTKFYTSNLSFLGADEDIDVFGANLLSEKFRLNHITEKISFFENRFDSSYFDKCRELRKDHVYGGWHGGEFLGGYFLKAAPINNDPGFNTIDTNLKRIFSFSFRLRLKKHPYKSYLEEKNKLPNYRRENLFLINQLLRSFFTSTYGGSRGHWLQPYQLTHHGFSPFWDSRFLTKLLEIPTQDLKEYAFYNEVFKYCDKEFTDIPSNSPLTLRSDSVIPSLKTSIEPKRKMPDMHHQTYQDTLAAKKLEHTFMYNKKKLAEILKNENDAISKRWLDFEIWRKHCSID